MRLSEINMKVYPQYQPRVFVGTKKLDSDWGIQVSRVDAQAELYRPQLTFNGKLLSSCPVRAKLGIGGTFCTKAQAEKIIEAQVAWWKELTAEKDE